MKSDQSAAFVYAKDGKVKVVLDGDKAKAIEAQLLADGWVHTSTLAMPAWIEYVLNDPDIFQYEQRRMKDPSGNN
jgi:hypothetical protein